jgi:iron complex outermembrane receptor protein
MNKMEWLRGFTLVIGVTAILTGALGAQETKAGDSQAMTVATPAAPAAATPAPTEDLTQVSLESLMGLNVVVTSSAKKAESLMNATSAIFVITQEDIQQSGARSIPDLLTMVPGVQVARQNNNQWAISARGFDDQYNDKMLVLVDGRSVYQPITGGVNWNQLDIPLEEIDRIEVIRGPGGALWGSNAINGVINIITKDAKTSQGLFLSTSEGMPVYSTGTAVAQAQGLPMDSVQTARYGGSLGDSLFYKIDAQASYSQPSQEFNEDGNGSLWNDGWNDGRAGFRLDYHGPEGNDLNIQGGAQKGYFSYFQTATFSLPLWNIANGQPLVDQNTSVDQNAYLQGQWTRSFKDDSQIQALVYYSYDNQSLQTPISGYTAPTITNLGQFDAEFQHRFHLNDWNEITWGGGFRNYSDQFLNPVYWYYTPSNQSLNIYNIFLQDRFTLVPDLLYVTGGIKAENNSYTGWEWQPSGRILFTPDSKDTLWGSVSRAVRIPSQALESSDIYVTESPIPGDYVALIPNSNLQSEVLTAYELGYRANLTKEFSLDLAGFYNSYSQLVSFEWVTGTFYSPAGGTISNSLAPNQIPIYQAQNNGSGDIWGGELSAKWNPVKTFQFALAYTYEDYDQAMVNSSNSELGATPPHNMVSGRVSWEALPGWRLNGDCYWVDATFQADANLNPPLPTLSPYTRVNVGSTLKVDEQLTLGLWGMDLEGTHTETIQTIGVNPTQIVPRVYGRVAVTY